MKYGWEIADEVQRFVGNSSEMQFVSRTEYETLLANGTEELAAKDSEIAMLIKNRDYLKETLEAEVERLHEKTYALDDIIKDEIRQKQVIEAKYNFMVDSAQQNARERDAATELIAKLKDQLESARRQLQEHSCWMGESTEGIDSPIKWALEAIAEWRKK